MKQHSNTYINKCISFEASMCIWGFKKLSVLLGQSCFGLTIEVAFVGIYLINLPDYPWDEPNVMDANLEKWLFLPDYIMRPNPKKLVGKCCQNRGRFSLRQITSIKSGDSLQTFSASKRVIQYFMKCNFNWRIFLNSYGPLALAGAYCALPFHLSSHNHVQAKTFPRRIFIFGW